MIEKLIAWSIRRRELVALGAIFVLVAGVFLLRTMPVDAIPDLSDTQVIVYTDYPGQAPQVVEDQVTYPLLDRKSTRLNSSHSQISYAVFCLKKKYI